MKRSNKAMTTAGGWQSALTDDHGGDAISRFPGCKCGSVIMSLMGAFVVLVMGVSVLFTGSVLRGLPSNGLWRFVESRNLDLKAQKAILNEDETAQPDEVPKDKLLDDLLPPGIDEKSCLSRYQSLLYRRGTPRKASPYLIAKLRSYEARHRKCGPHTDSYNRAAEDLRHGRYSDTSDCKYVVWICYSGLGNRMLTLAATFLYALLTDRVLLVDRGKGSIPDMFCEPFPETSWLLPLDFPLIQELNGFNLKSNQSYGNCVRNNATDSSLQPYMYLHLVHDYDERDQLFFCDQDQAYLQKIPWLIVKSNNYFLPAFFLMPSFEQELQRLFPDKETVFHFLGRYLFNPANAVWGLVSRYYEAYLSKADVKVGIQIRLFDFQPIPFKHLLHQILSCTTEEDILPPVKEEEPVIGPARDKKRLAVLITSLDPGYFEEIRDWYWEHPTVKGEVISVFQPSQEKLQQNEKQDHNRKAWAEMYLLSLMDKLVTSSWSTFGYVAQGLAGLKPWVLYRPNNKTAPDPACGRDPSMEPCFHAPLEYDCKMRKKVDAGALVPHIKHCLSMEWGVKLFDHHSDL